MRKTESAISSNEELGPATVKARIAQIGAQIPIGGRRGGEDINRRTMEEPRAGEEEQKAPLPAETIKVKKTFFLNSNDFLIMRIRLVPKDRLEGRQHKWEANHHSRKSKELLINNRKNRKKRKKDPTS